MDAGNGESPRDTADFDPQGGISTVAKIGLGLGAAAVSVTVVLATANTSASDPAAAASTTATSPGTTEVFEVPFAGLWKTIDDHGVEVALALDQNSEDGYTFVMTDGHADQCEEFGAPITGVLTGTGEVTGSEIRLSYETLVCETQWGEITKVLATDEMLRLEEGTLKTSLPSCYRLGPAQPCDGVEAPEPIQAEPDIESLVEEYGLEWVQDNYQGDLVEIGLDPSQLYPCQVPDAVSKSPLSSDTTRAWSIETVASGVLGLPRHISCADDGVFVYLRNTQEALFFNSDGRQGKTLVDVGEPKGNESLVVFHNFDFVKYMKSTDEEPTILGDPCAEKNKDDECVPAIPGAFDAVPIGEDKILVTGAEQIAIYDLDGSELWSSELGGFGEAVLGSDAWWVADNESRLYRIPLDGSEPGDPIAIPEALFPPRDNPGRRPAPGVVPVFGGVWITNSDGTVQYIGDDGVFGDKLKAGGPATGDGVHITNVQQLSEAGGYLYTARGRVKLGEDGQLEKDAQLEEVDAVPLTAGAGCLWFQGDDRLIAVDQETGEEVLNFKLQNPQGMRFNWAHGVLWIADQNHTGGFVYRIGP